MNTDELRAKLDAMPPEKRNAKRTKSVVGLAFVGAALAQLIALGVPKETLIGLATGVLGGWLISGELTVATALRLLRLLGR